MKKILIASIFALVGAGAANAATVSVTSFSKPAYDGIVSTMGTVVVEDFEDYSEMNVANGWMSKVGSFYTLGGVGSGGTVTDQNGNIPGNDGSMLALRDGNVYGRTSTTKVLSGDHADDMFLDSNDTYGIGWIASLGGQMFDRLVLTLTDATDVGAIMKIIIGSEVYSFSGLGDANTQIVDISFGSAVSTASILFQNVDRYGQPRLNDGFSIDDIAISAVPLPAGVWFMLGGFGLLAAMRRRKMATA